MRKLVVLLAVLACAVPLLFYGCSGSDGSAGAPGAAGAPGTPGTPGSPGTVGAAAITNNHGTDALEAAELATAGKFLATVNITSATADASGVATVHFTVTDNTVSPGRAVTGITAVSAGIFKLVPATAPLNYNRWVPYIYRSGRTVNAGYRENNTTSTPRGTLVETTPGSYTYTFGTNLSTATYLFPIDNVSLVGYDRALTHRVSVYMGGHNGATGEADFDFVPNGTPVTETRNIVQTATCKKCHGPEFNGHGGDRVTVEGCNGCHSPNSAMVNTTANGGTTESIEMAVMLHKMHAGRELASSAGVDGQFYDNPNTTSVDETADNYHIGATPYAYTVGSLTASWRSAAFPAVLGNCQACHTGSGANVDNWKTRPSRAACGSCHDTINWVSGTNHAGGSATSDTNCAGCHPSTGAIAFPIYPVPAVHNWTDKDERNIPEYNVVITTDTPSRGYYQNGESPVISITLTNKKTGNPVAPNSVIQDNVTEGCGPIAGPAGSLTTICSVGMDGYFTSANVYVTGPRAQRIPVLTYGARAAVRSANAGPWNVSAGGDFNIVVDSGQSMVTYNNAFAYEGYGQDELVAGTFKVTIPAADNTHFVDNTAATAAEIAAFLNADTVFSERAIAYVDEALVGNSNRGKLAIRSRGLLEMANTATGALVVKQTTAQPNVRVVSSPAGIFAANAYGTAGGAIQARIRATLSDTDPKAAFPASGAITYTLDPVDDLVPGTYVINVEFADRGRPSATNPAEPPYVDYVTPSVAVATFQVKQAAKEKPIADGCTSCHWSDAGIGFVLDNPRHDKLFDNNAVDQCGGCHMYKSGMNALTSGTPASPADFGTKPLSRRVHAVHYGANLQYPTITVGHEETAAFGRNWNITYPMEVRNCESCHSAATSGTWKTNPNRVACGGCHDADATTAHMKANTYDPTPNAPFSGDEQESCKTCH